MAFNLNEFAGKLTRGGARASLFEVRLESPFGEDIKDIAPFMVKAAEIPASSVAAIEVPYFGRRVKMAGDRTFADWTVTIINDEDFKIRAAMEEWSNAINNHQANLNTAGASPVDYKVQAQVVQYGKEGNIIRTYNFNGLFPTEVSNIALAWDAAADPEEFTVTFAYDWWNSASTT